MSASLRFKCRVDISCFKCLQREKIGHCRSSHRNYGNLHNNNKNINRSNSICNHGRHQLSHWRQATKFAELDRDFLDKVEPAKTVRVGSLTRDEQKIPKTNVSIDDAYANKAGQSTVYDMDENTKQKTSLRNFSLHFPKSSVILNVDAKTDTKEVSFHIPDASSIINVNIDDTIPVDDTNPSHNIESVEEHLWQEATIEKGKLLQYYLKLSKIRLTGLVVVTTMAGYAMAPAPFHLGTFLLCSVGTTLTSCSANATNQYFEVPFDSQMNRTKNRVLVRGHLSSLHAVYFAVISGTLGLTILTVGVNPLTAALGAFNLGLYTLIYTPMKRYSIANTWVGSVVGAVPPMMGWTACTGAIDSGAILLGAILYAWQFPHFNALSWNLRPDYSRSGYRMTSVVNPALCKRVALRYSAGMIGLCTLAPVINLTTWTFAVDSFPLNAYMTYLAWQFYQKGDSNSSRKLFRFTLGHIPALLVLMLVSKKSLGDREPVKHTELTEEMELRTKDV